MTRLFTALAAIAAVGFAAINGAPVANSQSGPGWIQLFDGKTMDGWTPSNDNVNWRVEDGALVADKSKGKGGNHLVTKNSYKDHEIYAEFWTSDDANSGIFVRCDPKSIGAKTCYEVNIFDTRPDPSYGTGSIVYFTEVNPMPKAGGKWNTFEITAKGPQHHRQAQRQGDREPEQRHVRAGPLHAPVWRRRGEIPQGRSEAAVTADL